MYILSPNQLNSLNKLCEKFVNNVDKRRTFADLLSKAVSIHKVMQTLCAFDCDINTIDVKSSLLCIYATNPDVN